MATTEATDLEKLQRQVADLLKRQSVTEQENRERNARDSGADPIKGGLTNIREHLALLAAAHPNHDLSDLIKRADNLGDDPTPEQTGSFQYALNRWVNRNGYVAHDFSNVHEVTGDVHQAVLDKGAKSVNEEPETPAEEDDESAREEQ